MRREHLDLLGIMVLATLVLNVTMIGIEYTWLRSLLALPLALLGVGYAVGAALFPLRRLGVPDRFLLSLGLSLSILILTSLVLNALPVGLKPESWAGMLYLTTIIACILALFRRWRASRAPAAFNDTLPVRSQVQTQSIPARIRRASPLPVLMLGLSAVLVAFSAGLVFQPAPSTAYSGYSMLWMVPLLPRADGQVELGVQSMELTQHAYRVDLYAGGQLVQQWDDIRLAPKEEWTVVLDINSYSDGNETLEAHLYRVDLPGAPYRQVRLWTGAALNSPQGSETSTR